MRRSGVDRYYCGQVTDPDSLRASDMEREAAVERLRVASVEGRLTLGELTTRTEAAYTAQTRGKLAKVTADLPEGLSSPASVQVGNGGALLCLAEPCHGV